MTIRLSLHSSRVISVLSYYLTSLVTSVSTALNKFLTGSGFHCLFAFSSGFLLIGSDPLLSLSNGLPWLAAGLRHECRFDFLSAYNLILILLFGICGSDFCVSDGRLLFRSFGICPFDSVFTNRKESFFKVCAKFRCAFAFQDVF